MRIYISDLRKEQFCSTGCRHFFKRHNFDWFHFLNHGIDSERLLKTGDAMAQRAVKAAKSRELEKAK